MARIVDSAEQATCEIAQQEAVITETLREGVQVRCVAAMPRPKPRSTSPARAQRLAVQLQAPWARCVCCR